jgi:hypothetical protein
MNVAFRDLNERRPGSFWRGNVDDAALRWEKIKREQCLSIQGALVIDAGNNCKGAHPEPEIHPVYKIRLLPDKTCRS